MSRRVDELGTLYRGREGLWSFVAHRVTGVLVLLFLLVHIVDTALVGWGPETYNRVVALYRNPVVELMELGLVGAVIYHALNGLRVMVIDFWPRTAAHQRVLTQGTWALFLASMAPIAFFMGRRIVEGIF